MYSDLILNIVFIIYWNNLIFRIFFALLRHIFDFFNNRNFLFDSQFELLNNLLQILKVNFIIKRLHSCQKVLYFPMNLILNLLCLAISIGHSHGDNGLNLFFYIAILILKFLYLRYVNVDGC